MTPRRVVITGIGLTSPIGNSLDDVSKALRAGKSGVRVMADWANVDGLATRIGAPCDADLSILPKKQTRTMGRVALLSTWATQKAIESAGLTQAQLSNPRTGLAYGSTSGSMPAFQQFSERLLHNNTTSGIPSSCYLKLMSHTAPANLAAYFAIHGRVLTTCSACVSSSQAIGYGYEAIRYGLQDTMLVGGAEEIHVANAAVFDIMFATSRRYNDAPERSPRPFDKDRDGLVTGEGAATLILESLEHAQARGAHIWAEIVGFGTNCDGAHLTAPDLGGMTRVMRLSLDDAGLTPDRIDYVNAHATSTDIGDVTESRAIEEVLGCQVPVSSTKGFTGHTLGACGAIETLFCVAMLRDGFLAHGLNLDVPDPACAPLDYVMGGPRKASPEIVMNNNFAFAGLNTSLILRKV
ncbi:MAG: beta-ketoacyl-ACP synthase [Myxococcales bacterium]|jgi:3-oxoacyl-[acyl-carrier-protein] synthase II|nr:beta-ketoacyl-ACP synthase [Myxococcales bacterium]